MFIWHFWAEEAPMQGYRSRRTFSACSSRALLTPSWAGPCIPWTYGQRLTLAQLVYSTAVGFPCAGLAPRHSVCLQGLWCTSVALWSVNRWQSFIRIISSDLLTVDWGRYSSKLCRSPACHETLRWPGCSSRVVSRVWYNWNQNRVRSSFLLPCQAIVSSWTNCKSLE